MNSNFETSPAYRGVISVSGRYRVAVCKDGLQWLVQKRASHRNHTRAQWKSFGYYTTKKALMRTLYSLDRAHMPEIARLPATFQKGAKL